MKNFITFVILMFVSFLPCYAEEAEVLPSQIGVVESVEYVDLSEGDVTQVKQTAEIKLLKGDLKGKLITVDNMITGNPYYDIKLQKGKKVVLHVEADDDGLNFSVEDIKRSQVLVWLSLLFCAKFSVRKQRKFKRNGQRYSEKTGCVRRSNAENL